MAALAHMSEGGWGVFTRESSVTILDLPDGGVADRTGVRSARPQPQRPRRLASPHGEPAEPIAGTPATDAGTPEAAARTRPRDDPDQSRPACPADRRT